MTKPTAIATRETNELTVHDHQQRQSKTAIALHLGTVVAVVLALLGVQPVVCAMLPSIVVSIPVSLWAWRDRQALKRRKAAGSAPDGAP